MKIQECKYKMRKTLYPRYYLLAARYLSLSLSVSKIA